MGDILTNLQNSVIRTIKNERKRREKIMSDIKTSIVRTLVPYIVGSIIAYLAAKGINVGADTEVALTTVLANVFSGVYYLVARYLEQKFTNMPFGLLLGSTKTPEYK